MPGKDSLQTQSSSMHQPTSGEECAPLAITTTDVFRVMIEDELRNGRLTPARRRRIVRYATAMGLSAVEAGDLITECRENMLENGDAQAQRHALKLVYPDPPMIPAGVKLAIAAIAAIALDLLLLAVVFS